MKGFQLSHFSRSQHGDLGVGKRPDELHWQGAEPFAMSIAEAAELLGVAVSTVRTLIRRGKLQAGKMSHRYFLRRSDVEQLAAQR